MTQNRCRSPASYIQNIFPVAGLSENASKNGFNKVLHYSAIPGLCHVSLSTGANALISEFSQMFLTSTQKILGGITYL